VKITLLPELFEPPVQHALVIALLHYPLTDRHRVELDTSAPRVAAWLAAQAPGLREEIEIALEESTRAEPLEPSHTEAHIVRTGPSDFESRPLRIHLDHARQFLDGPFVIVLEDASSDRAFLQRMMTAQERQFLQRRLDSGAVRVDHGGGLGPMARRMRAAAATSERHTMWTLFDSDAMQSDAPSAPSEELRRACAGILAEPRIPHHQLRRRYAESYLTHAALHGWAAGVPNRARRDERLQRFRAFAGMRDDQRYHYNMKGGFDADAERTDATAGALYDDIADDDRRALAGGFGRDICELFEGEAVTEHDLRRDASAWAELRPVIHDLLARIR
jgi:hypothetical protein